MAKGRQESKEPVTAGKESMELLTCTKCKVAKEATTEWFPLHNRKKNGLDSWCRSCRATYRSHIRRGTYKKFGYTNEFIAELVATGECVICGERGSKMAVDHCHKTGKVRGLLCMECNLGLGKFKDDPQLLEFARIYLLTSVNDPEAEAYLTEGII